MALEDVLATALLSERPLRSDQRPAEQVVDARERLSVPAACTAAMRLTHAESAGVSLFNDAKYDELTWLVVHGHLARFQGRRFPHRHSMCAVCSMSDAPQLFIKPHLHFQWMHQAGIGIREALVVPLKNLAGEFEGTLWVMTHAKEHVRFNGGDVEVLQRLAAGIDLGALRDGPALAPSATGR